MFYNALMEREPLFEVARRRFDAPEFRGIEFIQSEAKTVINRVTSNFLPFNWTINPYRGCLHSCRYCQAGDTPILLGDGRTKSLAEIVVGDEIYGTVRDGAYRRYVRTRVLAHWMTRKEARGSPFNRRSPGQPFSTGGSLEGAPSSAGALALAAAWEALPGAGGRRRCRGNAPDRGPRRARAPGRTPSRGCGSAGVEAEHELVQVARQVRVVHRSLMGAEQPPLGQRGDPVHPGQHLVGILAAGTGRPLAAPVVDVAEPLQPAVARPPVGDDHRARLYVIGDEGVQRGTRGVGERRHPAPAEPLRLPDLHGDAGQDLLPPGPAAPQSRLLTADVGLVHLHRPGQPVS